MKQSSLMSFIESLISTGVGFLVGLGCQWLFLPLLGVSIDLQQNLAFASIMTVVSIGRGWTMRRVFEALHIRRPLTPFMHAVIAERWRQIDQEGWSLAHDDEHPAGDLARAGGCYALAAGAADGGASVGVDQLWPWSPDWWKPSGFRRDLIKAGALVFAEGDKFDRARGGWSSGVRWVLATANWRKGAA